MNFYQYHNKQLHIEQVALADIAKKYGTPCFVYSQTMLENHWQQFNDAFNDIPHQICYAVKANSNLAILNLLAKRNSGFDIVSLGELKRVLKAGGDPKKIVFSGVGKKIEEIQYALDVGIHCFNVESISELFRINDVAAQQNKIAPIALRINPNIDAGTHPYIATGMKENKFGISHELILPLIAEILTLTHVRLIGIGCHIGSQLTEIKPFIDAIDKILELATLLHENNVNLQHINIGGGLGVYYHEETPPDIMEYASHLVPKLKEYPYTIFLEPGRAIVANAGILLTTVEYLKPTAHKNFAIVDAAMNDLIRPALYDAWHKIVPVHQREDNLAVYDIVGPVCESADFLGKDRTLAIQEGDLLAIHSAGAYGFSMSSNYNSRPRCPEVLVKDNQHCLIRERETVEDLFTREIIP